MNIPNALSLFRIVLAIVFTAMLSIPELKQFTGHWAVIVAFWCFIIAAVTDFLDGYIARKWNLVTGDKKQIYNLARKSYFAVLNDGDGGPYDMIHTENFILVDKEGYIRGVYNGTIEFDIQRLMRHIKILESEN